MLPLRHRLAATIPHSLQALGRSLVCSTQQLVLHDNNTVRVTPGGRQAIISVHLSQRTVKLEIDVDLSAVTWIRYSSVEPTLYVSACRIAISDRGSQLRCCHIRRKDQCHYKFSQSEEVDGCYQYCQAIGAQAKSVL